MLINRLARELLASYRADLAQITPLNEQEQQKLLELLAQSSTHERIEARNRLLEPYLWMAGWYAIRCCPANFADLLPDIIGQVNLTLLQAVERFARTAPDGRQAKLSTYLLSCVESAVATTIYARKLVSIPRPVWKEAVRCGIRAPLDQMQPVSLDLAMRWHEYEAGDLPMHPVLPTEAAPASDPTRRAHIEEWLSHLSARDELLIRLHFGLREEDERSYSIAEITRITSLPETTVRFALKRSLLRLRKLAEGQAQFRKEGERWVVKKVVPGHPLPTLTEEQESRLMQIAWGLAEQGRTISMRTLSEASGLGYLHTRVFLQRHRHELPPELIAGTPHYYERKREQRAQERQERIRRVYEQWRAEGKPLYASHLARAAHTDVQSVQAFLREYAEMEQG